MADLGGVEFLMELNAKLDQVGKMVKELTRTEAAVAKADAAMQRAEKRAGLLNRALGAAGRKIGETVRGMLSHFTALASFEGLKRLGERVVGLGIDLITAAAGAAKTRRAFEFLFGPDMAEKMENAADELAKHMDATDDQVKAAMQELGAAGLKPMRIIEAIALAGDAAAKTGKEGAFEGLINVMKVMQQTGKAPPGKALAAFGLDPGTLAKLQKEMKGGTKAIDAFLKVVDRTSKTPVGTAAFARGADMDVLVRKIKDLPDQYGQKLSKTAAFEKLREAAAGFLAAFDPDSPRGQKIFKSLEIMVGRVASVMKRLDFDRIANAAVKAFEVLPGLIESATKALVAFAEAATWFLKGSKNKQVSGALLDHRAGDRSIESIAAANVLQREAEKWRRGDVKFEFSWRKLLGFGEDSFGGMSDQIEAEVKRLRAEAAKVPPAVVQPVRKGLEMKSPSRVFQRMGQQTVAGFELGLQGSVPGLQRVAAATFTPPGLTAAMPRTAPGGTTSNKFEAHVTVNVTGAPAASGRETAEQVSTSLREALQSIFDDFAAQGGGS